MTLKELIENASEEELEMLSEAVIDNSTTNLIGFLHNSHDVLAEIINKLDLDSVIGDYVRRQNSEIASEIQSFIDYDSISGIPSTLTPQEIEEEISKEFAHFESRISSMEAELENYNWPDASEAEDITNEI